ncbi:cell growth regulator with RING finger domain protein 1 isoform X2 [Rhinoderma darwinii]|uniref:cell growth regulator with RING finger domain protein 1 isoform X2 n=1 Tax=Rhinoderma darwinii TaxID=43563 RepID=UPI003F66AF17
MPAIILATLYEYSPLFYITVVSICFVVTCGIVLGWRGLDVPVILRNSDETNSNTFICKKQMKEVKNPFGLEIRNPDAATIEQGVTLRPHCLEKCILSCYWGCSVQKVQEALQKHVYCSQIQTPGVLEDALYGEYLYKEQHVIQKQSKEEILIQLPEDKKTDFGPVPRTRYPLVALLTISDVDEREFYPIVRLHYCMTSRSHPHVMDDYVSMLTVLHIPDRSYRMPCRIMYQYLMTDKGQFYDLKQLYMSASDNQATESTEMVIDDSNDKELLEKLGISEEELQENAYFPVNILEVLDATPYTCHAPPPEHVAPPFKVQRTTSFNN